MFWKVAALMVLIWAVAFYYSFTLGGLIHLLPIAAVAAAVVRRMARKPDSEFGRWESSAERFRRR